MKEELEFLEYLYNMIKLERDSLLRIIKMRKKDDNLSFFLKEQVINYRKFIISLDKMIETRKSKAENNGLSLLAKMASHVGAKLTVLNENSYDDILDILIHRSNVCIDEINTKLKEYNIESKTIINLAQRFIDVQRSNVIELNKM